MYTVGRGDLHVPLTSEVLTLRYVQDPECCDGSDEWDSPTECPDVCAKVGAEYRAKTLAEQKLRKTVRLLIYISGSLAHLLVSIAIQGSKIRSSYIKFAQQERIKMADKIKSLEQDIQAKEGEVEAARGEYPESGN